MSSEALALVLNCGSSSIKFAIINPLSGHEVLQGLAERLFSPQAQLIIKQDGEKSVLAIDNAGHQQAIEAIVKQIKQQPSVAAQLVTVGHRVVHGGEKFSASTLIDDTLVNEIQSCNHLAPLHNPANVSGIQIARLAFPELPHIAVFDTAFHQTMPEQAYIYPLPYELYEEHGIRRYGFHGTSYRYITAQAAEALNKPVEETALVIAHLGNGASVAAVKGGQSMDTSMGMTPNEGIVHGTRSGSIDPSIHEYLAHHAGMHISEINNLLWKESGLLGISGLSNDCRSIEEAAADNHERAQLALDIYSYRLAKEIASLVVPLGRLDAVVFTGGIGENSSLIRANVVQQLGFLGVQLDESLNQQTIRGAQGPISTADSSNQALVIPTNEELMIAQDAMALMP